MSNETDFVKLIIENESTDQFSLGDIFRKIHDILHNIHVKLLGLREYAS